MNELTKKVEEGFPIFFATKNRVLVYAAFDGVKSLLIGTTGKGEYKVSVGNSRHDMVNNWGRDFRDGFMGEVKNFELITEREFEAYLNKEVSQIVDTLKFHTIPQHETN